jgi:hypothetical protein
MHDSAGKVRRFLQVHRGRQGVGVLAFAVDNVQAIADRYQEKHPALLDASYTLVGGHEILEVAACYQQGPKTVEPSSTVTIGSDHSVADHGTILRFVQFSAITPTHVPSCTRLGLTLSVAQFDDRSMPAFCDHWVSNVFDRTEFLDTLRDTLGFTPKVDFNAGVVAAGEAQIESTVTGNTVSATAGTKVDALRDQSQVYLPINNALSSVGHVHGFLKELGQGVQHIASRVENIVDFVQRCNDWRDMTDEGT